jgi:signal transduction histidine kinase
VGDNLRFLKDEFEGLNGLFEAAAGLEGAGGAPGADQVRELQAAAADADLAYLKDEIPKALQQSLEGLGRVAQILRAMKEFSHPGPAERTAIDLNRAIESTVLVCRNEWKYVADVATEFDSTLPLVPCLPGEINQVVLNLIINAAHAIGEKVQPGNGRGSITISTARDGAWVELRIRDNGTGIPEGVRDRVFDPFFTTKSVGQGTGQGLAIAHAVVVSKHGGSIRFETETGAGTVFIVRLPLGECGE